VKSRLLIHHEADTVTVHAFYVGCPVANADMLIGISTVGDDDALIEVTDDDAAAALEQVEREVGKPLRYCAGCCPDGALPFFTDEQWKEVENE
jgi:hypothetical protein